jgi:hypothetical protein
MNITKNDYNVTIDDVESMFVLPLGIISVSVDDRSSLATFTNTKSRRVIVSKLIDLITIDGTAATKESLKNYFA